MRAHWHTHAYPEDWTYTLEEKMADLATAVTDLATAVADLVARLAAQPDTQAAADQIEAQVATLAGIAPTPVPPPAP